MFAFYTLRNWIDDFTFSNYFICLWNTNTTCKLGDRYFQTEILFIPWPCHRLSPFTGRLSPPSVLFLDEKAKTLRYFKESYESSHHRTGLHEPLGTLYEFSLLTCIGLIDRYMDPCRRRVIENKLNGKSVRAWFEDPNLVHFIQKDYFSCTTQFKGFIMMLTSALDSKISNQTLSQTEIEIQTKPLSDFKSSHNDIPLVWYEQHHLGKIEHLGKHQFVTNMRIIEFQFLRLLANFWRNPPCSPKYEN